MKLFFKYHNTRYKLSDTLCVKNDAFSLVEVLTALTILALVASSVIIVIDRSICSAADSQLQMQAFEVAHENMETLLCKTSVEQIRDSGVSDKYPGITWQTSVETFFEPITARMWLRGVCRADYTDSKNSRQTVELTNWLTGLTTMELLQIMWQQEEESINNQILKTIEQAANYASVDVKTVEQWLDNGLSTTEEGYFVKSNLELFKNAGGNPSQQDKDSQVQSKGDLQTLQKQQGWRDQKDPLTGLTYGELEKMDITEIMNVLQSQGKV
jgi:prepilin-type N-terminal cleavage/methylation domain-containing protein